MATIMVSRMSDRILQRCLGIAIFLAYSALGLALVLGGASSSDAIRVALIVSIAIIAMLSSLWLAWLQIRLALSGREHHHLLSTILLTGVIIMITVLAMLTLFVDADFLYSAFSSHGPVPLTEPYEATIEPF